jgi:hypothetical protein
MERIGLIGEPGEQFEVSVLGGIQLACLMQGKRGFQFGAGRGGGHREKRGLRWKNRGLGLRKQPAPGEQKRGSLGRLSRQLG